MEMQSSQRLRISWSDLPTEIVQLISKFLFSAQDAQSFRAVCKQWRCATEIAAFLPCGIKTSAGLHKKVASSSIYLVRPLDSPQSPPWMVLSVKYSKDVTRFYDPFTRTKLQDLPKKLDLTKFRATQLATECHVVERDKGNGIFTSGSSFFAKTLLFFQSYVPSVRNLCLLAISCDGLFHKSMPFREKYMFRKPLVDHSYVDDIINYKGKVYALYNHENLVDLGKQAEDPFKAAFCKSIVMSTKDSLELNNDGTRVGPRKRLVVSSSGDKLYMIDPIFVERHRKRSGAIPVYFRVCELKKIRNSCQWDKITSFGHVDQVLFITRDYCFFVAASEFPGCQLKNCIVFSDDAFPQYSASQRSWDYGTKDGNEVAVFSLARKAQYSLRIGKYLDFPLSLWSLPPWVMSNVSSPSPQSQLQRNNLEKQCVQSCQVDASLQEWTQHECTFSYGPGFQKQNIEIHPADAEKGIGTTIIHSPTNVTKEGPCQETLRVGYITSKNQRKRSFRRRTVNLRRREPQINQEKQLVQSCQGDASLQDGMQHECIPSSGPISMEQTIKNHLADGEKETGTTTINSPMHVTDASLQEGMQYEYTPSSGLVSEKKTIEIHPADGDNATGIDTVNSPMHVTDASLPKGTQHEFNSSSGPISEKQNIEIRPADGAKATGPHQETLMREGFIHSVSRAYITSINQINNDDSPIVKFEGLNIRPSLVPTLEKIWSKHGNILENCMMSNGDTIARALESLATTVLILEGNSARSLSDDQADYLSSALSDLRCMCFEVDWLIPFVEKAVGLHKGKPLMDSFNKLSQLNDEASERRSALLEEVAKVDEIQMELKENMANLSKMIPFFGEDLELPLGGGLT